ncbi:hypothetical protein BAC1_00303 [uncultured bacterium]|nr:hypothetical protein BAC1_00303 [uncultured bacterium]
MKAGRNDLCPCGSGKKFKKCCMSGQATKTLLPVAQEIAEEIRKEFDDRPAGSLAEAQAVANRVMERRNWTPLAEFSGLSPGQMHRFLDFPFSSPGIASFAEGLNCQPEAPVLKLFSLLADAIGTDGLKATAKGNLPRQFCREAAMTYSEIYPDKALLGGINTEPDFFDLHTVRIVAGMAGLIRKYKDKFILTKKCRLALESSRGGVYLELFRAYTQAFNWAYCDGYSDLTIVQRSFLYTLYLLHKYGDEFRPPEFYKEKFIQAFPMALAEVPDHPYATNEKTVGRCYVFRSLEGFAEFFGLAEVKVLSKEFLMRKYEIRRSPLLDALVTFRV